MIMIWSSCTPSSNKCLRKSVFKRKDLPERRNPVMILISPLPLERISPSRCIICPHWLLAEMPHVMMAQYTSAWGFQRCTLKDDISYLLPTWLSAGTGKLKRKHHFIGWQERTNKMKNKSCATNFATQQPFSLLLLLQEPFLLAERKKMCYLSMATNQSQYTNINSFILGYIY